jgi:hypothetical protein
MAKRLVIAVVVSLWAGLAGGLGMGVAAAGGVVDLDRPGALAALQRSNPTHYDKVRRIMEGVLQRPAVEVPRWIRTTFTARDVRYAPIVLTSHPAKRRLSFALDDTRYEAVVTLTNVRGDIVPAR